MNNPQIIEHFTPLDPALPLKVIERLQQMNMALATAESLTGGFLGQSLTAVPGASKAYQGGVITYTNQVKMTLLNIPAEVLEKYSAVSLECAQAMAENVRRILKSDYSLATTGLAGPDGDGINPVGTVFIALSTPNETFVRQFCFKNHSRREVREETVRFALEWLLAVL